MANRNDEFLEKIELIKEKDLFTKLVAIGEAYKIYNEVIEGISRDIEQLKDKKTDEELSSEFEVELTQRLPSIEDINDLFIQLWKNNSEDIHFRLFAIDCLAWFGTRKAYEYIVNLYSTQYISEPFRIKFELAMAILNPNSVIKLYIMMGEENSKTLEKKLKEKSWQNDYRNILINYGMKIKKETRDLHQALKYFQKAVSVSPKHPEPWYNVGVVYLSLNEHNLALHSFQKSLELESKVADTWRQLGITYEKLGLIPQAIAHYQKAVELDPEDAFNQITLGMIYYRINNIQGAKICLQKAIDIDPEEEFLQEGIRIFRVKTGW